MAHFQRSKVHGQGKQLIPEGFTEHTRIWTELSQIEKWWIFALPLYFLECWEGEALEVECEYIWQFTKLCLYSGFGCLLAFVAFILCPSFQLFIS